MIIIIIIVIVTCNNFFNENFLKKSFCLIKKTNYQQQVVRYQRAVNVISGDDGVIFLCVYTTHPCYIILFWLNIEKDTLIVYEENRGGEEQR